MKSIRKDFEYHPAHQYAIDVDSGNITVCRWIKLAVKRYFHDIDFMDDKGFYFDFDAAEAVLSFYEFCPHYKGEWAGTPVDLEPWQQFSIWNVFGWKWISNDCRRFKIIYETVARKNGKTTKLAPIGLYLMFGDDEPGAEIYSIAHDKKQAREVFDASRAMALKGPLYNELDVLTHNINHINSMSKYEPLTADENAHHGKNIHGGLCDEVHVWPKRGLWSVIRTGMGSRRQPIQWAITTAGTDQNSICYELHTYAQDILKGFDKGFNDDTFFALIYTLDRKADWVDLQTNEEHEKDPSGIVEDNPFDETVWPKANPNLNISVKIADLKSEALTASRIPASLNDFLRLRCNVWTQQVTRWLDLDRWDANFTEPIYCYDENS